MQRQIGKRVYIPMILVWLVSSQTSEGTNKYIFQKVGEWVTFADYSNCSTLIFKEMEVTDQQVNVSRETAGVFMCEQKAIVLIPRGNLTIFCEPCHVLPGENVSIACTAIYWTGEVTSQSKLTLSEGTVQRAQESVDGVPEGETVLGTTVMYTVGSQERTKFNCNWAITVTHNEESRTWSDNIGIDITSNMGVTTPVVDKMAVEVDEPVNCSAEGTPPPAYRWFCKNVKRPMSRRSSKESVVTLSKPGRYNCTCTVFNVVGAQVYTAKWSGVITVNGEEDTDDGPIQTEGVQDMDKSDEEEENQYWEDLREGARGQEKMSKIDGRLIRGGISGAVQGRRGRALPVVGLLVCLTSASF